MWDDHEVSVKADVRTFEKKNAWGNYRIQDHPGPPMLGR